MFERGHLMQDVHFLLCCRQPGARPAAGRPQRRAPDGTVLHRPANRPAAVGRGRATTAGPLNYPREIRSRARLTWSRVRQIGTSFVASAVWWLLPRGGRRIDEGWGSAAVPAGLITRRSQVQILPPPLSTSTSRRNRATRNRKPTRQKLIMATIGATRQRGGN